jgi:c-di-GMP-binding flagellar brake protein YcgR
MSGWAEKRGYQRVAFLCRVDLTADDGATVAASTVDISLGGAGVASPRFVAEGKAVTLTFHLRDKQGAPAVERVIGRVAHARADVDGHLLGVEFLQPLQKVSNPLLTRAVERL